MDKDTEREGSERSETGIREGQKILRDTVEGKWGEMSE